MTIGPFSGRRVAQAIEPEGEIAIEASTKTKDKPKKGAVWKAILGGRKTPEGGGYAVEYNVRPEKRNKLT